MVDVVRDAQGNLSGSPDQIQHRVHLIKLNHDDATGTYTGHLMSADNDMNLRRLHFGLALYEQELYMVGGYGHFNQEESEDIERRLSTN